MTQHQEFDHAGWQVIVARVGIRGQWAGLAGRAAENIHTLRFGGRGAKAKARESIIAAVEGRRAKEYEK